PLKTARISPRGCAAHGGAINDRRVSLVLSFSLLDKLSAEGYYEAMTGLSLCIAMTYIADPRDFGATKAWTHSIRDRWSNLQTREQPTMTDSYDREISRRGFLTKVGAGLVAANVSPSLLTAASAQRVPEPPGKKAGWAIVGLGNLSINEILPAFSKCEKSRVVAFVSGHPEKANKLALRYGVNSKNIY